MQLYWHYEGAQLCALQTVPENRVYVRSRVQSASFEASSSSRTAKVVSDDSRAPGVEIGRPGENLSRIRIESTSAESPCSSLTATCRIPTVVN